MFLFNFNLKFGKRNFIFSYDINVIVRTIIQENFFLQVYLLFFW